jgi:F-type H+-transporting ATPase subunit delta
MTKKSMKITSKQYAQTLYDLTDGKSEGETEKSVGCFVDFLIKSRKLKLSGKIIEQFSDIYNKRHGIVRVEVTGARKLSEEMTKEIKGFIKKKYKAEEVELVIMVDEGLKGGIILKVGDEIMDGSVAGRLSELKKILVK